MGQVIEAIDALRKGRSAKKFATERNYFQRNAERMKYRTFKALGLPYGSGAVESAVRRVVNLRMKSNSLYWRPDNAERFLHLRAQFKSGRWDVLVRQEFNYEPRIEPARVA